MFLENPHFLGKKPFVLLFAFLFVDLGFSFLPLKYFIYFKRRSFRSEIVAKFVLLKKFIFHHSHFFSICRVSTFKVYAEGKSFTDYDLIIVLWKFIFSLDLNSSDRWIVDPTHLVWWVKWRSRHKRIESCFDWFVWW